MPTAAPARRILALWFSLSLPVDRRSYALTGFSLMGFKYAVDALAIWLATGERWLPTDYLSPWLLTRTERLGNPDHWLVWPLLLWTLPFLWIGASMTVRRGLDAGLGAGSALLFFVPGLNYLWMLTLCVLRSAPPPVPPRWRPEKEAERARLHAVLGPAAWAGLLGLVMTGVSTLLLASYGSALFVTIPGAMGFTAGVLCRRAGLGGGRAVLASQLAVALTGGGLLLLALEGALCVAMAWPLASALAVLGALLGSAVGRSQDLSPAQVALLLLALPLLMAAEAPRPPVREVVTAIEIDAPPEAVWPHVVGFSELPPPTRWVFRTGIAYPLRARISGEGVGAVRHCEFSTGAFVEPITAWEPPRRLAFDVVSQPEPMQEWSPYRTVHAPHLVDGLVSHRGEFRLVALSGGRTRLEGSTWYTLDLHPQPYWSPMSDALIHAIHERVLAHIRSLAEAG